MIIRIPKLVIGGAALAVAVILLLILVDRGGGKSEEDEVRDTVTQLLDAARAGDEGTCQSLQHPSSPDVKVALKAFGGGASGPDYCLGPRRCTENIIDKVAITGDTATVTYVYVGDVETTALVKENDEWLVNSACRKF